MQVPSQMFIDGRWVDAESSATSTVLNPTDQGVLATLPKGGREDARTAIDAASEALRKAESMSAYERSKVLLKAATLLEQNAQEMATLITKNVGKPIT